jgi:hypothetical protein
VSALAMMMWDSARCYAPLRSDPGLDRGEGSVLFRAFLVVVLIAFAEALHGAWRVRVLNRRVGDRRARQMGVFTGSGIVFVIAWATVPWIGATDVPQLLAVGALWLVAMLAFDVAFGRWVFKASWQRIGAEFDLRRGGLLGLGMLFLLLAPLLAAEVRGLI